MIEKPQDGGRQEAVSLDSAATHLLEECRMVLPGIQALFGFQMVAVFNEGFSQKLSQGEQYLHLAAIVLVVIAIALVTAPAPLHRGTSQRVVSERFIWLASRMLLASMLPLVLGLCIEVYIVTHVLAGAAALGFATAVALFAAFFVLWVLVPARERRRQSGSAGTG